MNAAMKHLSTVKNYATDESNHDHHDHDRDHIRDRDQLMSHSCRLISDPDEDVDVSLNVLASASSATPVSDWLVIIFSLVPKPASGDGSRSAFTFGHGNLRSVRASSSQSAQLQCGGARAIGTFYVSGQHPSNVRASNIALCAAISSARNRALEVSISEPARSCASNRRSDEPSRPLRGTNNDLAIDHAPLTASCAILQAEVRVCGFT